VPRFSTDVIKPGVRRVLVGVHWPRCYAYAALLIYAYAGRYAHAGVFHDMNSEVGNAAAVHGNGLHQTKRKNVVGHYKHATTRVGVFDGNHYSRGDQDVAFVQIAVRKRVVDAYKR
jgi:hypothetical protein